MIQIQKTSRPPFHSGGSSIVSPVTNACHGPHLGDALNVRYQTQESKWRRVAMGHIGARIWGEPRINLGGCSIWNSLHPVDGPSLAHHRNSFGPR